MENRLGINESIISFTGEYGFLSNFSPHKVFFNANVYKTAEHAFQANKTLVKEEHDAIQAALTPGQAKRLGRKCTLRPDWDDVKDQIMVEIVRAKFQTNPALISKLLATGNNELIEGNNWGDKYWGAVKSEDGTGWVGDNKLGKLLMKIRDEYD